MRLIYRRALGFLKRGLYGGGSRTMNVLIGFFRQVRDLFRGDEFLVGTRIGIVLLVFFSVFHFVDILTDRKIEGEVNSFSGVLYHVTSGSSIGNTVVYRDGDKYRWLFASPRYVRILGLREYKGKELVFNAIGRELYSCKYQGREVCGSRCSNLNECQNRKDSALGTIWIMFVLAIFTVSSFLIYKLRDRRCVNV
ncbi:MULTISPECIES: hypothetical protein [Pseudomonas]|uniref:hypothetical protein n=1 Tax=Pseudomonas TaxID=286 RepID=UPI001080A62A|nr:hypothetical protein [Pseudomonas citronellolis]